MSHAIIMPSLAAGMEHGTIGRWLKLPGDIVAKGEAVAEVETDKATIELEADHDGILDQIVVDGGKEVPVGEVLAYLRLGGEKADTSVRSPLGAEAGSSPATSPDPIFLADNRIPKASPLARRIASERFVSLAGLTGSGPNGRIVRLDVEREAAKRLTGPIDTTTVRTSIAQPVATPGSESAAMAPYSDMPLTSVSKTIVRRLAEAKATIPHFYLTAECEVDALLELRSNINAARGEAGKLSINDFILKAAALAVQVVPDINVVWTGDAIRKFENIDVSVAISTEGGLITPIIRTADMKTVSAISNEVRSLAQRAREGRLQPAEYQGGGFTISNLGMHGVRSFSAIINPPQSCILAVGATERRAVVRGQQCEPATLMNCTLSVDHRSVDGVLGAQYLAAFKAIIEQPLLILA